MKWMKSTTQKTYQFMGLTVPQCVTKDNKFLPLTDDKYNDLMKNNVVKSLINNGAILVTDTEPLTPTTQVSALTKEKADLIRRNTELEEKLKSLGDSVAKSEYDALLVKYGDLEKEAKETIADLQKQLAEAKTAKTAEAAKAAKAKE